MVLPQFLCCFLYMNFFFAVLSSTFHFCGLNSLSHSWLTEWKMRWKMNLSSTPQNYVLRFLPSLTQRLSVSPPETLRLSMRDTPSQVERRLLKPATAFLLPVVYTNLAMTNWLQEYKK